MIFVDSSVWINYINGSETSQTHKLDMLLGRQTIVVGDLVLTEVLQGCNDPKVFKEALNLFSLADFVVVGGYQVALQAAKNYRTLRTKGITVRKTVDTLIATCCILNKYELLHCDRDFVPFEKFLGLKTVK